MQCIIVIIIIIGICFGSLEVFRSKLVHRVLRVFKY